MPPKAAFMVYLCDGGAVRAVAVVGGRADESRRRAGRDGADIVGECAQ